MSFFKDGNRVSVKYLHRVCVGQGEGKPRPYHIPKRLVKPVYGRGEACPRPDISRKKMTATHGNPQS